MLHAVIMAGGSGKRFWPQSRRLVPKQLLQIAGKATMIEETVARVRGLVPPSRVTVLTNEATVPAIRKLLNKVPKEQIVGEPVGRDTTAALGLGAALVAARDPEGVMICLPADHVITPVEAFHRSVKAAAEIAASGPSLVTFGIKPTEPATGYGYIERGDLETSVNGTHVYRVARFVEKPDLRRAREYVATGRHFWNGGIFCWRASSLLNAIRQFQPKIAASLDKIAAAAGTRSFQKTLEKEFPKIEKISIDYAVMEKSADVRMIEAAWKWDDVGSWSSVWGYLEGDGQGNAVKGKHFGVETQNCIILSNGHLVGTVGVKDLIIVQTKDATLICPRDRAQDVKKLVDLLEAEGEDGVL